MKADDEVSAVSVWATERRETGNVVPFDALDVQFLTIRDQAEAARIWATLERRIGHDGLACSWAWIETLLKHYGDQVDAWFAIGRLDGEPVAAALLTRSDRERRGPFRIRTLHLGAGGEASHESVGMAPNRLLVAPHLRRAFARGLAAGIETACAPFDQLRLDGFEPEEIAPFQKTDLALTYDRRGCHATDLAELRDAGLTVLEGLHAAAAAKIERAAACFEVRFGPLFVKWAESVPDGVAMLADLRGLHDRRSRRGGAPWAFANSRFAGFHQDVIERLMPTGRIAIARVTAGDQLIGVNYGFIERNRVLSYQMGIEQGDDRRLAAEMLIGALVMQAALDRGLDEFNWLAGDAGLMRELGAVRRELVWGSASRGARMRALKRFSGVRRQATRG